MRSESDEYYDLVKRSTGEVVGSIRAAGRVSGIHGKWYNFYATTA